VVRNNSINAVSLGFRCARLWHDRCVIAFLQLALRLFADLVCLVVSSFRPRRSLEAENLVRRRQHPLYRVRGDQRWSMFISNHAKAIVTCGFFVAVTSRDR